MMPITEDEFIGSVSNAIEVEGLTWTAGPTELTALSSEEQRARLGVIVTPEEMQRLTETTRLRALDETQVLEQLLGAPVSVDWRNVNGGNFVTPVKDQGSCGSCVSFGTCATMEAAVRVKVQNPNYIIDLSEAFCQFCGGADCSGWGLTSGLEFAQSTGVTDEACMPYQARNLDCGSSRCSDWQKRLLKISSHTPHSTMEARKSAIATNGPVLAGMAVYNDFYAYRGGVYVKTAGATYEGLHCICVVGYDDAQQCWIVKNSWGTNWGEGGFIRIKYQQSDLLIDSSWSFYSVLLEVKKKPDDLSSWISILLDVEENSSSWMPILLAEED